MGAFSCPANCDTCSPLPPPRPYNAPHHPLKCVCVPSLTCPRARNFATPSMLEEHRMVPQHDGRRGGGRSRHPFDDPFFTGGGRQPGGDPFAAMDQMMTQMDSMFGGGRRGPGGLMGGPFGSAFGDMDQMMSQASRDGAVVSSSSYSYSSSGGPGGHTYERTVKSHSGPGGVSTL